MTPPGAREAGLGHRPGSPGPHAFPPPAERWGTHSAGAGARCGLGPPRVAAAVQIPEHKDRAKNSLFTCSSSSSRIHCYVSGPGAQGPGLGGRLPRTRRAARAVTPAPGAKALGIRVPPPAPARRLLNTPFPVRYALPRGPPPRPPSSRPQQAPREGGGGRGVNCPREPC